MISMDAASSAQLRCVGDGGDLGAVVDIGGVVEGLALFGGKAELYTPGGFLVHSFHSYPFLGVLV